MGGAQGNLGDLPWLTTEFGVFDSEPQCDPSLVSLVLHCHFKIVYEGLSRDWEAGLYCSHVSPMLPCPRVFGGKPVLSDLNNTARGIGI